MAKTYKVTYRRQDNPQLVLLEVYISEESFGDVERKILVKHKDASIQSIELSEAIIWN